MNDDPLDDDLRGSLHQAADGVSFAVPDLLPQARAARRGRRVRAAVAGSGLVVAALLLIPPMFGPSRAVPAAPTPAPSDRPSTATPQPSTTGTPSVSTSWTGAGMPLPATGDPGAVVSHDEIVARCQSQLARSVQLYGPAPADLRVARDRDYREGDIVRLVSDTDWDPTALCLVPADGVELDPLDLRLARDPLPADPADPGKDPYLMQACSELYTHEDEETGVRSYDTADLRDGRVVSMGGTDDPPRAQFHATVSLEDKHYSCGWSYGLDGALRFFSDDYTEEPSTVDPPSPRTRVEDEYWDGVSPTAEVVLTGYLIPGVASIETENSDGAALWYSTEIGMFRAFIPVTPKGTKDAWTAPDIVLYGVDEHGSRVYEDLVSVGDPALTAEGDRP